MFKLGQFVHDRRWAVIVAWLAAVVALRAAAPPWSSVARDSDLGELPRETTTARGARLSREAFPGDLSNSQIVVVLSRVGEPLTLADRQWGGRLATAIEELPGIPLVGEAWTEQTPVIGDMLRSPGGHASQIVVRLTNDFMAVDNVRLMDQVYALVDDAARRAPPGLEVGVTGSAAIGGDLLAAMRESLRNTEWTTIVAVAAALALIYRSLWLVVVPLGSIAVAVLASIDLLALLAEWSARRGEAWPEFRVYSTTQIFIIVLLFGAGTDFCLFLIARFRELRARGAGQREAIVEAVGRVGGAIAASAGTTIAGLAMMAFSEFGKFTYSGPAIAISLAVALAVCLTLAPAILATRIGGQVLAGADDAENPARPSAARRAWAKLADAILRRPGVVLATSLLAAAPLAWYGLETKTTYDIFSELPRNARSAQGARLLLRNLPPGEIGPLMVLVRLPGEDFTTRPARFKIAELTKLLVELPGVDKVRSLYRPTGEKPGAVSITSTEGIAALAAPGSPQAQDTFVSHGGKFAGEVTRLTVVLADGPFSREAVVTADRIERALDALRAAPDSPWRDAQIELVGVTSGIRDLERVTTADRRRIQLLTTAAVFAVILALLRRPVVCCYLIATVVANYFVTLGVMRLVLEAVRGPEYPGLDWKAPIFLFVILVAVGQDYNIFLVTRVFEEQRRHGKREGLRRGLVQTGGIITSCGVIMAATFGSMIAGSLPEMADMGLALALGILLDTLLVRPVLVPAFLALVDREPSDSLALSGQSPRGGDGSRELPPP
jgi:RND superfamily putative drug exporter